MPSFRLGLAVAGLLVSVTALAQPADPPAATADPALDGCATHKFETIVVTDAGSKRGKRVRLCSKPGATDADWVRTLEAAIAQAGQQDWPEGARAQLVAELKAEIARVAPASASAPAPAPATASITPPLGATARVNFGEAEAASPLAASNEPFRVSTLPSLDRPRTASGAVATPAAVPPPSMSITIKCLERGESGAGGTCAYFEKDTVLAVRAGHGLEKGGALRFLRRGEERGEVALSAMQPGQVTRARLPLELCRGVKATKVEIQLLGAAALAGKARPSATLGPYGLRC